MAQVSAKDRRLASREWCAYVRVSQVRGRAGDSFHSPDEQEQAIRAATAEPVVRVFQDLDVSGGSWERKGLDGAVLWMREAPTRRGVIVYDVSRLGRDLAGSQAFVELMISEGLRVRVLSEDIDTSDPDARLKWQILMSVAEHQRTKSSARWKSIHQRRRDAGRPASGIGRFGYRRLAEGESAVRLDGDQEITLEEGDFVPDPETGPLLAECYRRYVAGAGYQVLAMFLNNANVTTSRNTPWTTHSLRRTLDSGFGAGRLILTKGGYIAGRHQPVITEQEWEAFERARERRKGRPSKTSTPRWYLSGIARCGLCGAGLVVSSHADAKATVLCGAYKNSRICTGVWIPRYMIETAVSFWVGAHISELAAQAWDSSARDEVRADVERRLEAARQNQEATQTALSRLATGYATGLLDEASVREARPALERAKAESDRVFADVYAKFQTLAPVDMDEYERLASAGEGVTPSEWGTLLGRVLSAVNVTNTDLTFVPVVGQPQTRPRPAPRKRPPQAKDLRSGRFLASGT